MEVKIFHLIFFLQHLLLPHSLKTIMFHMACPTLSLSLDFIIIINSFLKFYQSFTSGISYSQPIPLLVAIKLNKSIIEQFYMILLISFLSFSSETGFITYLLSSSLSQSTIPFFRIKNATQLCIPNKFFLTWHSNITH